jgi:lantibiotic biosynthesis protein
MNITTQSQQNCLEQIIDTLPNTSKYLDKFYYEDGSSGLSLFYCFLAKYSNDESYYNQAEEYFNISLKNIHPKYYKKIYPTDTYDAKLASFGRLLLYLNKNGFVSESYDEYLNQIDDMLDDALNVKIKMKDFDLTSGTLAHGYYLYCQLDRKDNIRGKLSMIVNEIEKSALQDEDGDYYWTSPTIKNRVYFGISHGSAMMIAFLSALYEEDVEKERCYMIIQKTLNFLLKNKRTQVNGLFPHFVGDDEGPKQLSLCYGDLGVGYGILRASQIIKDQPNIRLIADEVLDACLLRKKEDKLTHDASLTYGASGLSYLFDKIYRTTNTDVYKERADYWSSQILNYQSKSSEFAGFESIFNDNKTMCTSYSWGIIGIGITLMKSLDSTLPNLDGLNQLI